MAGTFTAVDLGQLQAPAAVEVLDYEIIFESMLSDLRARDSTFTALVESDPAYKILEIAAYRELLIRQRVNDAARAVMLAYAVKTDLDQIAANYNVGRLLIAAENTESIPPTPAVYESDDELRRRVLLALEGYTTAGSVGSYLFHAMSASGDVLDAAVENPPSTAGTVRVAILSRTGTGAAPAQTLADVGDALNAEIVRPLCDTVVVSSAVILNYAVSATLKLFPGTGSAQALDAARASLDAYTEKMRRLGLDITRSGLFAAIHVTGVQNVTLASPAADVVVLWNQAAHCTGAVLVDGGYGE